MTADALTFEPIGAIAARIVAGLTPPRVEKIHVGDRTQWLALRRKDVTASVAGALLGVHPYQTAYGLALEKTGRADEGEAENGAMRRGRLLEPAALAALGEDRPDWTITPMGRTYYRDASARIGATPDAFARAPDRPGFGIVQVKTVAEPIFGSKWRVDGEVTLPLWIAVQANVESYLAGADWACVAAMVVGYGLDVHVIDVPLHPRLMMRVRDEVRAFWAILDAGQMPDPDYARDGEAIARAYADAIPGTVLDLSGDNELPGLLAEREAIKAARADHDERLKVIEAEIKAKIGDAETAILPGWRITHKTTHRKGYAVAPTTFRALRIANLAAREAAE